jgi:hypothetical protein
MKILLVNLGSRIAKVVYQERFPPVSKELKDQLYTSYANLDKPERDEAEFKRLSQMEFPMRINVIQILFIETDPERRENGLLEISGEELFSMNAEIDTLRSTARMVNLHDICFDD